MSRRQWERGNSDEAGNDGVAVPGGVGVKVAELAERFEDETQPYRSLVHPMWKTHYGDYDHLARVKEWSETAGALGEGIE